MLRVNALDWNNLDPRGGLAPTIDVHKALKRKDIDSVSTITTANIMGGDTQAARLDWADWLPFAAKPYQLSPDPNDYILHPVIAMLADLPNRNGIGFPLDQLVKFNPQNGCQNYKTARGKGAYLEHQQNTVPHLAKGLIVDSFMHKASGFGAGKIWKLVFLMAYDRTKCPDTANDILSGEMNSYSMGSTLTGYKCSVCQKDFGACRHLDTNKKLNFQLIGNELAYKMVQGPNFFETSSVKVPAYACAISSRDHLMVIGDSPTPKPNLM